MSASESAAPRWATAWYDMVGFGLGLALAWHFRWEARDLVWSLWLASLTVGFAMIVWNLAAPVWLNWRAGDFNAAMGGLVGGVFLLGFFAVHFGMFHFVHSMFLNVFLPVGPPVFGQGIVGIYGTVVAKYWWFVPLALLAEREAFRLPQVAAAGGSRTASFDQAAMFRPYRNVVRLHLLIFFFAGAHFMRIENFAVYAVVYAVYFFPWRLLRAPRPAQA